MGSSKCVIPGVHLKVFGRAIQSLSKIGDELYFEPLDEGLCLRTVNSSRSAYACFKFAPSFFITYVTKSGSSQGDSSNEEEIRCKLTMKSVTNVFRSLPSIDKTVERCKITFNLQEDKLVFQMCCRHGIVKTHNLSFMECETLQAIFSRDLCPNKLTAGPKLLCDAVVNFQASQEEVTLLLRPDYVALKNYVDDEPNPSRVIHTELTLSPDEFDHFQVGVDTEATFVLKEFRAILAFADLTNLPINLHIESPGRPITFSITSDLSFEANFVLATLAQPEEDADQSQPERATARGSHQSGKSRKDTSKNSTAKPQYSRQSSSHNSDGVDRTQASNGGDQDDENVESEINDTTVLESHSNSNLNSNGRFKSDNHTANTTSNKIPDSNFNGKHHHYRHKVDSLSSADTNVSNHIAAKSNKDNENDNSTSNRGLEKKNKDRGFYVSASEDSQSQREIEIARGRESSRSGMMDTNAEEMDDEISQIIPIRIENRTVESRLSNRTGALEEEEDDGGDDNNDDEQICGTPPSKRFRSLFFNTQSDTQSTTASQPQPAVLCPDSDSDDD